MNNINTFNAEISQFRNSNFNYIYSFNSAGNLFFKDSGQVFNQTFLKVNGVKYEYNDDKISQLLKPEFEEFLNESTSDSSQTSTVDYQTLATQLNDQVLSLQDTLASNQTDVNTITGLTDDVNKSKAEIIALRIKLKQGSTTTDFSEIFPYESINITPTTTGGLMLIQPGDIRITSSYVPPPPPPPPIIIAPPPPPPPIVYPSNPLAMFDKNGDDMLDASDVTLIQTQYALGNPIIRNILSQNPEFTSFPATLDGVNLTYIINQFYNYVFNVSNLETPKSMLAKFDVNKDKMLDSTELDLLAQQHSIGNPAIVAFDTTTTTIIPMVPAVPAVTKVVQAAMTQSVAQYNNGNSTRITNNTNYSRGFNQYLNNSNYIVNGSVIDIPAVTTTSGRKTVTTTPEYIITPQVLQIVTPAKPAIPAKTLTNTTYDKQGAINSIYSLITGSSA